MTYGIQVFSADGRPRFNTNFRSLRYVGRAVYEGSQSALADPYIYAYTLLQTVEVHRYRIMSSAGMIIPFVSLGVENVGVGIAAIEPIQGGHIVHVSVTKRSPKVFPTVYVFGDVPAPAPAPGDVGLHTYSADGSTRFTTSAARLLKVAKNIPVGSFPYRAPVDKQEFVGAIYNVATPCCVSHIGYGPAWPGDFLSSIGGVVAPAVFHAPLTSIGVNREKFYGGLFVPLVYRAGTSMYAIWAMATIGPNNAPVRQRAENILVIDATALA